MNSLCPEDPVAPDWTPADFSRQGFNFSPLDQTAGRLVVLIVGSCPLNVHEGCSPSEGSN